MSVIALACCWWLLTWDLQPPFIVRSAFMQPVRFASFVATLLTSVTVHPIHLLLPCAASTLRAVDYPQKTHVLVLV